MKFIDKGLWGHVLKVRVCGLVLLIMSLTIGCASTLRTSPALTQRIKDVKTIAVLPPDIEVYKFTAGGLRELIDEWSDEAKKTVLESLEAELVRRGFHLKIISQDQLNQKAPGLWRDEEALYQTVAASAYLHAFDFADPFPAKKINFDYTLGSEINELAKLCEADYLLFIYGYDHEATSGRKVLFYWNVILGAATGAINIPTNPSVLSFGFVDGKTGDLHYFKVTPPRKEYSFQDKETMEKLTEWMIEDF